MPDAVAPRSKVDRLRAEVELLEDTMRAVTDLGPGYWGLPDRLRKLYDKMTATHSLACAALKLCEWKLAGRPE